MSGGTAPRPQPPPPGDSGPWLCCPGCPWASNWVTSWVRHTRSDGPKAAPFPFPGRSTCPPNPHATHVTSGIPAGVSVIEAQTGTNNKARRSIHRMGYALGITPLYPSPNRALNPHVRFLRATSGVGVGCLAKAAKHSAHGSCRIMPQGDQVSHLRRPKAGPSLSRLCPGNGRNHSMRDNDKAVTAVTAAYVLSSRNCAHQLNFSSLVYRTCACSMDSSTLQMRK